MRNALALWSLSKLLDRSSGRRSIESSVFCRSHPRIGVANLPRALKVLFKHAGTGVQMREDREGARPLPLRQCGNCGGFLRRMYQIRATMTSRNNHRLVIAKASACCLAHIAALRKAVHYVCAAHLDEHNDFPYAAALEWRKAAELFGSDTPVAEYCWRQWERIVQLPRRLAGPISDSSGFAPAGGGTFFLHPAGADNASAYQMLH